MSNGTITKIGNTAAGLGTIVTQPTLDLLTAMGHGNGSGTTEEFVNVPGYPQTYNAANFTGATNEAKINAMIAQAISDGATAASPRTGFIPATMLPYGVSLTIADSTHVLHNSAVHMICEGGSSSLGEYDVHAYGASEGALSHTAIQAAMDAASTDAIGHHTVRIDGSFFIEKPLWAKPTVHLKGEPQGNGNAQASELRGNFYGGPILFNANANATVTGLTSALVGSGNAWQGNQFSRWFNLRDHPQMDVNGLTQFCVECFVKHPSATNNTAIVWSGGRLLSTDTNQAFALWAATATGIAQFFITLTSGVKGVNSLASIADNTVHHLAGTYDGSTVRFFVDGVLQGSVAGTGTIVQAMWEDVTVGVQVTTPPEQNFDANGASITIDSLRISNTARYTAGFTAPTQKLTGDANTLILMNFSEQWGPTTKVVTKDGDGWALERNTAEQGWTGFEVDGISFLDTGKGTTAVMLLPNSYHWSAENVNITSCRNGIYAYGGNAYDWGLRRFYFNGDSQDRYGLVLPGAGGIGHLDSGWIEGYAIHAGLCGGSIHVDSVFFQGDQNTVVSFYAPGESVGPPIQVDNCNWNNEPGSTASLFRANILLRKVAGNNGAIFNGCYLESVNAVSSAPYVILNGAVTADFRSTLFRAYGTATPSSIVQVVGTLTSGITLDHCVQASAWIPWSDVAGSVILGKLGKLSAVAYSATPTFDCSVRDEFEITLTGDCAPSITNVTPGQSILVTIIQDGAGSHLFTWPANVKGGGTISATGGSVNQQRFTAMLDSATNPTLMADAAMVSV